VKDDVIGGALCSSWEDENCTQSSGCRKKKWTFSGFSWLRIDYSSVAVFRTKHNLPNVSCIVFRNPISILNSANVAYVRSSHGEVREYET